MPRIRASLSVFPALAALLATVLAGCTTGAAPGGTPPSTGASPASGASSAAYPVTITHALGTATIPREPKRVVTLGWSDADHVAALGVAPVGAPKVTWGGNANQSTDWFDAQLATFGGAAPTRFDDSDGNPVEEIAQLQPDLILATNSGITRAEYDKLSKLAPVVAYPEVPWGTPWQDSLETIGRALGRTDRAAEIEQATEAVLAQARAAHPELAGKTFIYGYIAPTDRSQVGYYTPSDLRPQMLTQLGLVNAPIVEELAAGSTEFYRTVSAEQAATLESDIFLTYITEDSEIRAMKDDPLLGTIPAIADGALVATKDQTIGLTMSSPTPLSIPHLVDRFVPLIAQAAAQADTA